MIDFCGLTELEYLHLEHYQINDNVLLSTNTKLVAVWLTHNRITSFWFPEAPNLRTVKAHNNQLTSLTSSGFLPNLYTSKSGKTISRR